MAIYYGKHKCLKGSWRGTSIQWKREAAFSIDTSDLPRHRILSWLTASDMEPPLMEGGLNPVGWLLVLPMIALPLLHKQAHPGWHVTKSIYQTWGPCWINIWFNSFVSIALSGKLNCDSNTASLISSSLNSICSFSMVLQFLVFMANTNGDNQVFLMMVISQSIKDWFPSYYLRLCSLCLKKEWVVITKFFCLHSNHTDPIYFHVPQSHKPCYLWQALPLLV